MGRCIVYTGIRLLLHICPFVSFFFLSNFQTLKFFVTIFSGTVRPRRVKLGTHVNSGQIYHVYRNQAADAYSSLYFFIFLSLQFSNINIFRQELWRLEEWSLVHMWTVGRCTGIRLLLLICCFISSFFSLSNFQTLKFLSHFSPELWGLEGWNLVHMWTVGRCIVYTWIRLLLLFIFLFLHFSFSPIFKH